MAITKSDKKEITVPQTLKDCPPHVLAKWGYLVSGIKDLTSHLSSWNFKVQVVSIFSGESKDVIRTYLPRDVDRVFNHIITIINEPVKEPKGEVKLDGVKYVFNKNFNEYSTGQIIDLKVVENVHENPYEVLAVLYVEEGMEYNQLNDKGSIVNPAYNRQEVFKEGFPGDEFLNVFDFFLNKWQRLKDAIWALEAAKTKIAIEKAKKEVLETMSGTNGRRT